MKDPLKQKRRLFCCYYARLCNLTEAARLAGFPPECAYEEGLKTLALPASRKLLEQLSAQQPLSPQALVRAGLERLAFGAINDAAWLIGCEELPGRSEMERLDLFNVAELKRVKGGGLELKFFDRQKALERLYELSAGADSAETAKNLLEALRGQNQEEQP